MSYADDIRALLAKKEAIKQRKQFGYYGPPSNASPVSWISQKDWEKATRELEDATTFPSTSPGQIPIVAAPTSMQAMVPPQKKAGWGWAFLILGSGIFVFWGIPLIQGKGKLNPGMSKTPGYAPTRNSPGTSE